MEPIVHTKDRVHIASAIEEYPPQIRPYAGLTGTVVGFSRAPTGEGVYVALDDPVGQTVIIPLSFIKPIS